MVKILTGFLLLLNVACTSQQSQQNYPFDGSKAPFDIDFEIVQGSGQYYLITILDLEKDAYVISPHSQDGVYGNVDISIEKTIYLKMEGKPRETPKSVEEIDSVLDSPVRFIREKTIFKQKISVTSPEDFEVSGLVWFVVEPSCVPHDIEFTISYHSGMMSVKKTKTAISADYQRMYLNKTKN